MTQNNGTDDTSPTFKGFEEGSSTLSKEDNALLALRREKFTRNLNNALKNRKQNLRHLQSNRKANSKRTPFTSSARYP